MKIGGMNQVLRTGLICGLIAVTSACSTMDKVNDGISSKFRGLYSKAPSEVGRQPTHLMFHKDHLALKGPIKKVTYQFTRPDFTGTQVTEKTTLEFNTAGFITRITGKATALKENGFLQYWDLPANAEIIYNKKNALISARSAEKNKKYSFKGGAEEYAEDTGNLKSWVLEHTVKDRKKYRTLDYMIYAGDRYMVLSRDNRKPEENIARVYVFDQLNRLRKVYLHENSYPLDKKPSVAMRDPLKYRFNVEKEINYDKKGRINHVMASKRKGAVITEDRISYDLRTGLPKRATKLNGTGAQQARTRYKDYKVDDIGNWTERRVTTSYRRGDKEGVDLRNITYFTEKELR